MSHEPAAAPPPEYAIKVRSYQVFDNALVGTAVHNEIIFEHNGKPMMSMNGNPWKRETGQPNFPGIGDNNTLRVGMMEGRTIKDNDTAGNFPVVGEQTLYQGNDPAKFLELVGRAAEAAKFVNAQNLDYIMVDPLRTAQNSNSVAHTLTHAMGLEYPPETENLWAPGHGRLLLPEGHRSVFEDMKNNPNWMNDPNLTGYFNVTLAELEALKDPNVGQQVLKDPKTPNAAPHISDADQRPDQPVNVPTYFNPQNPSARPGFGEPAEAAQQPAKKLEASLSP